MLNITKISCSNEQKEAVEEDDEDENEDECLSKGGKSSDKYVFDLYKRSIFLCPLLLLENGTTLETLSSLKMLIVKK